MSAKNIFLYLTAQKVVILNIKFDIFVVNDFNFRIEHSFCLSYNFVVMMIVRYPFFFSSYLLSMTKTNYSLCN